MTYSLRRTRDDAGDSGPMSMGLWKDDSGEGTIQHEHNCKPRVGVAMRVGCQSIAIHHAHNHKPTRRHSCAVVVTLDDIARVNAKLSNNKGFEFDKQIPRRGVYCCRHTITFVQSGHDSTTSTTSHSVGHLLTTSSKQSTSPPRSPLRITPNQLP